MQFEMEIMQFKVREEAISRNRHVFGLTCASSVIADFVIVVWQSSSLEPNLLSSTADILTSC